jgi:hypothetical protein
VHDVYFGATCEDGEEVEERKQDCTGEDIDLQLGEVMGEEQRKAAATHSVANAAPSCGAKGCLAAHPVL